MKAIIHPATQPLTGIVDPPSSKNYTSRYILASCLAKGRSTVIKPAVQDDAVALVRCAKQLGAVIVARDNEGNEIDFTVENATRLELLEIDGFGDAPKLPGDGEPVDPDNAGAVLRLLMGAAVLGEGEVTFDTAHYKNSLGKRPNRDLLDAFAQLGIVSDSPNDSGALPVTLRGGKRRIKDFLNARRREQNLAASDPVEVTISGAVSSQYLSALLFMAPLLDEAIRICVTGELKSKPLIDTTRAVLSEAGIMVESSSDQMTHTIRAGQNYAARRWEVNGDWPGSAAILAAAAVVPGSEISIRRLREDEQGERRCLEFYRDMGCQISTVRSFEGEELLRLTSPFAGLRAAEIDGDLCTDAVLAMMGASVLSEGECRFEGIENLQFKECDRVREPINELRKIYAASGELSPSMRVWWDPPEKPESIHVLGNPSGFTGGIEVDGRGDHRVIMMLSIVGLRCHAPLTITGAEHVAKSFPGWFETLREMGAEIELV